MCGRLADLIVYSLPGQTSFPVGNTEKEIPVPYLIIGMRKTLLALAVNGDAEVKMQFIGYGSPCSWLTFPFFGDLVRGWKKWLDESAA